MGYAGRNSETELGSWAGFEKPVHYTPVTVAVIRLVVAALL
jgi:hypothetical protein